MEIYHATPKGGGQPGNFTDMTILALEECNLLFDLGLWALKNLGPLAFEAYNRDLNHLPMIQE